MSVDVVVVAYRSAADLRACVEPLAGRPGLRVFVVSNACPEASAETVRDLTVTIVENPRNLGFAAGVNRGVAAGRAPAVLLLNPDARIAAEAVERLAAGLANSRVGIVAPRIVDGDGSLRWSLRRFPRLRSTFAQAVGLHRLAPSRTWVDEVIRDPRAYETPHPVEWASGAALLVRRTLLEQIGGLDAGFFMYCEDTDLCYRTWTAGYEVRFDPAVVVAHDGGHSAPRPALAGVLAASRLRYAGKHRGAAAVVMERAGIGIGAGLRLARATLLRSGTAAPVATLRELVPRTGAPPTTNDSLPLREGELT